jgi:hypothetical protein
MADGKPKGDIRDLYGYYRFSDHTLTNIVLKDKALFKNDVWFEGFMDWGFTNCTFDKSFYFGVEGERLEEDTRGKEGNPEPFPPYGSNGLNFDGCTFNKLFEIKDNCVVVFKDCTFVEEFSIEDSVRVEFIGCTFAKGITFKTFCEVRFIRCEFNQQDFCIDAADHCSFYINNCTHGNPADKAAFGFDNDCKATFHSKDKTNLSAIKEVFKIANSSVVKVYNYGVIKSVDLPMANVTGGSKIEIYETTHLSSDGSDVFKVVDSEVYMKAVECCGCPIGRPIYAENSLVRSIDVDLIKGEDGIAIEAIDSEVNIVNTPTIQSAKSIAIYALNSKLALSDITEKIFSALQTAVYVDGTTEMIVRRCPLIESGQKVAIYIDNGAWLSCIDVDVVLSGASTAIKVLNGGRWTDKTGIRREGIEYGLDATDATIEIDTVDRYVSADFVGIQLVNCGYDIRNIALIEGLLGGFHTTNGQGVVFNLGDILGTEGPGVLINGASGPTEWDTISLIESSIETAWVVSGDLYGLRAAKIGTVRSEQNYAIDWNQSGGDVFLYDINTIESLQESAVICTVNGRLRFEKVNSITSEEKEAMFVTVDGGEAFFNDIVTIEAPMKTALTIAVNSGEAHFNEVQHVVSEQEGAIALTVAEGATLRYNEFNDITSEMGTAIEGTVSGELVVTNGVTIESQMASGVLLDGEGATYSFIRFADIDSIKSAQLEDHLVGITSCSYIQLHKISSLEMGTGGSSSYIAYLRGNGGNFGRCEVIDCPSFTADVARGGLYLRDFFDFDVVCSREKGKITLETSEGGFVFAAISCNGRIANFSEIIDNSNKATKGILIYGLIGSAPGNVQIWNIDTIQAKETAVDIATYGHVQMFNVGEIKTPEGFPAMRVSDGQVTIQGGSSHTKLSAKEPTSEVFQIIGTSRVDFIKIETEISKGITVINNAKNCFFYDCKLNGTIKTSNSSVEFFDTETTSGYDISSSAIKWFNSTIKVGQNEGTTKKFEADGSSLQFMTTTIEGSEDITISDSDVLMQHTNGSSFSGKLDLTGSGSIFLGTTFPGASEASFDSSTGALLAACDFPDVKANGGVVGLCSTLKSVDVGASAAFLSLKDTISGSLTLQSGSGAILNSSNVTGSLTGQGTAGIILNSSDVSGSLTLGSGDGLIANRFSGGTLATSSNNGCILSAVDLSSLTVDTSSGVVGAKVDGGGSIAGALVLAESAQSGQWSASGSVVSAGLPALSCSGAAVMAGGGAGGTGAAVQVLGFDLSNPLPGFPWSPDGTGYPRCGIRVYTNVLKIWNEDGSTEGGGTGTSIVLGMTVGGGGATGDGYALDPRGQIRSGEKIYDIAAGIHHNLPEPFIPD